MVISSSKAWIVVELNPKSNRLTVMSPLVGTPAHKAGLRSGDTILKINDTTTEEMQLKDSVTLMRGKPGTPVKLEDQGRRVQGRSVIFSTSGDQVDVVGEEGRTETVLQRKIKKP